MREGYAKELKKEAKSRRKRRPDKRQSRDDEKRLQAKQVSRIKDTQALTHTHTHAHKGAGRENLKSLHKRKAKERNASERVGQKKRQIKDPFLCSTLFFTIHP